MSNDLDRILGRVDNPHSVPIDPKDIIKIIKEASTYGVLNLEYGDLRVTFKPIDPQPTQKAFEAMPALELSSLIPPISEKTTAIQNEEESQVLLQETLETRSRQIDELLVTDPLEYERLAALGELEDNGQQEEDDSRLK